MKKNTPTQCGKCGGNNGPFTLFMNATTAESYALCINCMSSRGTEHLEELAEVDELIEKHQKMLKEMEEIVQEAGEMEDLPPALEAFAITPMKAYKMAQLTLASLQTKRLELLSKGENEGQLKYELEKKIAAEEYEEASKIQQKLNKAKAKPKRRKRGLKGKRSKKTTTLFDTKETAVGRCPRCEKRFPKPAGLFREYDLGNCHELCLPCCAEVVPQYVDSAEMADALIAEMERFSQMMQGMSLIGRLMTEGEENLDYDTEKANLEKVLHPESRLMINRLQARKAFLLNPTTPKEEDDFAVFSKLMGKIQNDEDLKDSLRATAKEIENIGKKHKKKTAKKKATKKQSKKPSKPPKQLSAEDISNRAITWARAQKDKKDCPKCKKYPIKPAIIFEDYDLGECNDLCFICSREILPLQVTTVPELDGMISEMQRISDFFDELMVIGELYAAGEQEKAKEINIKEMEVEATTPEQFMAREVLRLLNVRRNFLEAVGEEEGLIGFADDFIRLLKSKMEE